LKEKKALLKVGYGCNNNCAFCHSAPHRGHDSSLEQLRKKIESARRLGAEMVVLSGGEPTIRRDLSQITAVILESGMRIGLVTNGRMLSYPELAGDLVSEGLGYAYVSLCGPDSAIHDRHTRTESFNQTLAGLENLAGKIDDLTINLVITSWNVEHLGRVPDLVAPLKAARLKLSMIEPEGSVLDDFEALVPPLSRAAEAAADMCRRFPALLDGFPLCLIPEELRGQESGLREDGFFIMSEAFEDRWYPVDDANRSFGDRCRTCSLRRRCRGVYRQYLIGRGEAELRPESRPVSNSFNFEPQADPVTLDLDKCVIRAGKKPPPDPVRGILVSIPNGTAKNAAGTGRFQHHWTPTRDFSDAAVNHGVREMGQVYRSLSGDRPRADIKSDLERLSLATACRDCQMKPLCGGAWEPAGGEPGFKLLEERLHEMLSALSGSMLDVGCGRAPYLSALADGLRGGAINYLGIDPGEGPEHLPDGARFLRSTFTDFEWTGPPFDNLLAILSLNHLPSAPDSIAKMAALTVPGGTVLLADDEVFGVVRERQALRAIESGADLPFEHLTNLQLDETRELAALAGLQPVRWYTADQNGCPAWLLECLRE
jgi:MoaA/NifB/PqqE/SkfB family radical SAM enzyme